MATKPTRLQQQTCDKFAQSLVLISDAARLDDQCALDSAALAAIANQLAQASRAFDVEQIVARAIEARCRAMALPPSAAELLTLMETDVKPLGMLLLSDDDLRSLVQKLEAELGDV